MQQAQILVVDDETVFRDVLCEVLRKSAHTVQSGGTVAEGLAQLEKGTFDLVISDLRLPDRSGLELLRKCRETSPQTHFIMITAYGDVETAVEAVKLGADDYLTKPFSVMELTARVKALFRRVEMLGKKDEGTQAKVIQLQDLTIDIERHAVVVRGSAVELTAREFELLVHFARHPGRVYSRDQLLDQVWGYQHSGYDHTVNSHINRLRSKIERDPQNPEYIHTVWGVGYKFADAR